MYASKCAALPKYICHREGSLCSLPYAITSSSVRQHGMTKQRKLKQRENSFEVPVLNWQKPLGAPISMVHCRAVPNKETICKCSTCL